MHEITDTDETEEEEEEERDYLLPVMACRSYSRLQQQHTHVYDLESFEVYLKLKKLRSIFEQGRRHNNRIGVEPKAHPIPSYTIFPPPFVSSSRSSKILPYHTLGFLIWRARLYFMSDLSNLSREQWKQTLRSTLSVTSRKPQ